jgi:acyl-CoA thioester hydrolase
MEAAGVFLVVAKLDITYRAAARYDDHLVLVTRVVGGGRARIDHEYELYRDENDGRGKSTLLAQASSVLACVDPTGRPMPLPDWLTPPRRPRHA